VDNLSVAIFSVRAVVVGGGSEVARPPGSR
jgi:hypothetical protein